MWQLVASAAWLVGSFVYERYFAKKPDAQVDKPQDAQLPQAEAGSPIPLFWGRVRISSPSVIFARQYEAVERTEEINGDRVVVGYNYRLAVQYLLGTPGNPDDSSRPSGILRVYVGDGKGFAVSDMDETGVQYINHPTLLGGVGNGGGVEGVISYLPGSWTQTNNSFLRLMLAAAANGSEVSAVDVAYRGQAIAALYGIQGDGVNDDAGDAGYYLPTGARVDSSTLLRLILAPGADISIVGTAAAPPPGYTFISPYYVNAVDVLKPRGWNFGESPNIGAIAFEVDAPCWTTSLGAPVRSVGVDANPVNVLYDVLVNGWSRAGLDPSKIDKPSFLVAANTVRAESNGYSRAVSSDSNPGEMISEILKQIDGILFMDPSTDTLKLKLIRDDYSIPALDVLNPSNVLEVLSYDTGNWAATFNEVRVAFSNRDLDYKGDVAIEQNLASINSPEWDGVVRSTTNNYPGCCTAANAQKLAARDLRAISLPVSKLQIACDRSSYARTEGSVFRFTWPDYNISDRVYRIVNVNRGKPGSERIVLTCIEDRFAFDHTTQRLPPIVRRPLPLPYASTERLVEEAPRFFNVRSRDAGRVNDADLPRAHHLAVPRGASTAYHAEVSIDGRVARDVEPQDFPARARVETAYARELEPYDTSTGLRITLESDVTIGTATEDEISNLGKNTLRVGDEIVAFEGFTLISGTANKAGAVYLLDHVWRGLLDTVPVAHAVGERVFFLSSATGFVVSRVGRVSWKPDDSSIAARQVVTGGGVRVHPPLRSYTPDAVTTGAPVAVDDDHVNEQHPVLQGTIGSRPTLPYPPCDLTGDGSKTPAQLAEGGIDLAWKRRDRLRESIYRGDKADEAPEAGAWYMVVGRARRDIELAGDYEAYDGFLRLSADLDYLQTSLDDVLLAKVGYGAIDVGAAAFTFVTPPPGLDVPRAIKVFSWQAPVVTVDAPHWRNLLLDGRFDAALDDTLYDGQWSHAGSPSIGSGASGLGAGGSYLTASAVATTATQKLWAVGFNPTNLAALVHVFHKNISGSGSASLTATVEALDNSGATVATANTGALTPSTSQWTHTVLSLAGLPSTTVKLRLTVDLGSSGKTAVTECILRVGQQSSQLLANAGFEVGGSWPTTAGAIAVVLTPPLYEGAQYAQASNAGTNEMHQDASIPTGFEVGAVALLECARMDAASSDQGEVILEARDGGGTVLASATTTMEHIATGTWARRRLALDIPTGATTLRTRFATTNHGAVDDFDLRIYKDLDPSDEREFRFDTPVSQPVPADLDYFDRAWPTVTSPDLCFWAGRFAGVLGIEPRMSVDLAATAPPTEMGKFVGPYDATTDGAVVTTAILFPPGCDAAITAHTADFASFDSTQSFTFYWQGKIGPDQVNTAPGLFFRSASTGGGGVSGTLGWQVYLDNSGHVFFKVAGDAGEVGIAGTRVIADGAPHAFAVKYDGSTNTAYVIDEDGVQSASTASVGEILVDDVYFTVGSFLDDANILGNSVLARLYGWRSAIATADLQSMMTYGTTPTVLATLSAPREASSWLACVVGVDADGVVVSRFDEQQLPYAYDAGLDDDNNNGLGVPMLATRTNAVTDAQQVIGSTDWSLHGGTKVDDDAVGVEGFKTATTITGTNAQGYELGNLTGGTAATKVAMWFARATTTAHTARTELRNASGVVKGTHDYAVTTSWALIGHTFTTWDNSTPKCVLRFCATSAGTSDDLQICGPFFFDEGTSVPPCVPLGAGPSGYTNFVVDLSTVGGGMPIAFNVEGELLVEGICPTGVPIDGSAIADVFNGVNSDDYRALTVDTSGKLVLEHEDGAGASNLSSTAAQTTWNAKWTARGRWCRAGLLDAASKYAGAIYGDDLSAPSAYGRTTAWTPGTSSQITTLELGFCQIDDPLDCVIRRAIVRTREERL